MTEEQKEKLGKALKDLASVGLTIEEICENLRNANGLNGAKRWRAEVDGIYYYIGSCGMPCRGCENGLMIDDDHYETSNYFKTSEQASNSIFYHVFNSEYFYWFPDMPKPLEQPKNVERFDSKNELWVEANADFNIWYCETRRWPK